ncbi:hypothetical protein EVAR_85843_1 [Eumeta japonica]|uniref:Uncharacterized protein n=1 Tax=Eumeta variegata TaxID=151549 RepID=A0A4C1US49_EUMVA|nr:hypothetical protein EVAR_85843_1 [Eumeta japonica]
MSAVTDTRCVGLRGRVTALAAQYGGPSKSARRGSWTSEGRRARCEDYVRDRRLGVLPQVTNDGTRRAGHDLLTRPHSAHTNACSAPNRYTQWFPSSLRRTVRQLPSDLPYSTAEPGTFSCDHYASRSRRAARVAMAMTVSTLR